MRLQQFLEFDDWGINLQKSGTGEYLRRTYSGQFAGSSKLGRL